MPNFFCTIDKTGARAAAGAEAWDMTDALISIFSSLTPTTVIGASGDGPVKKIQGSL